MDTYHVALTALSTTRVRRGQDVKFMCARATPYAGLFVDWRGSQRLRRYISFRLTLLLIQRWAILTYIINDVFFGLRRVSPGTKTAESRPIIFIIRTRFSSSFLRTKYNSKQ
jgi:hypothetical protein